MTIALATTLFVVMVWAAMRQLPAGLDGHRPFPYFIAFIRWLWIPALAIGIISGVSRNWALMVLALALTADLAYLASPSYRKSQERGSIDSGNNDTFRLKTALEYQKHARTAQDESLLQEPPSDQDSISKTEGSAPTFTIMTLNCRYGRANAEAIVRAVNERDIDILALQEVTVELTRRLEQAGLSAALPYRQLGEAKQSDNGGFNGLYSRFEPISQTASALAIPAADVPGMTLPIPPRSVASSASRTHTARNTAKPPETEGTPRLDGNDPEGRAMTFYSAHPKSPMRGCGDWSRGILALRALANRQENIIVMGDLNSNLDHPSFRALLQAGLADAGLSSSHRFTASFPTWLKWPRLELDHILTTYGLDASGVEALFIPGSDHFALVARIRIS